MKQKARPHSTRPARRSHRGLHEGPYNFVPVRPEAAVTGTPRYHDGLAREPDTGRLSGELHCTLEALTPLFVGNEQVEYGKLPGDLRRAFDRHWPTGGAVDPEKKFLFPLQVGGGAEDARPVLISGSGLKGAMRGSLGALLSAPLERVGQRTFSYRATAQLPDSRGGPVRVLAARVVGVGVELQLEAFPLDRLIWVKDDPAVNQAVKRAFLDRKTRIEGVTLKGGRAQELIPARGRSFNYGAAQLDIQRVAKGLDGKGTFGRPSAEDRERPFKERPKPGREWVLAPLRGPFEHLTVSAEVVAQLKATLQHVADRDHGHLAGHPKKDLNVERAARNTLELLGSFLVAGDDVVFVEVVDQRVISIGLHFRYRWGFRNSVHFALPPGTPSSSRAAEHLRPELRPLDCEQSLSGDGRPEALSAARLLFGYVSPERERYDPSRPDDLLTHGIGAEDHRHLAGRVAINFAVEHLEGRTRGAERFLRPDRGGFVPLAPLSSPKPSAYEFYLESSAVELGKRSDGGLLGTWGDTVDDPSAGSLRGRKLYLHQPPAASDPRCYGLEGTASGPELDAALQSQQSAVCHRVSTPGTTFRFKVRFRDLAEWELGALVLSMAADATLVRHLVESLGEAGGPAQAELSRIPESAAGPAFALKLGHGRPLGLGSVQIRVDALRRLEERSAAPHLEPPAAGADLEALRLAWVEALASRLRELGDPEPWARDVLVPWLAIHRFAGRTAYSYPRLPSKEGDTIYAYHMAVHREHGLGRKRSSPDQALKGQLGLKPVKDYK